MKFNQEYYFVNDILAEWNPIGVPDNIAKTEYSDYVQRILNHKDKLSDIIEELEIIVTKDIGLDYNPNNSDQKDNTVKYAKRIYKKLQNYVIIDNDDLLDRVNDDKFDSNYKRAASALLAAMEDWPTSVNDIEDFINEVKNDVGEQVTSAKLRNFYTIENAWKMESSSSIIQMLNYFPDKSFDDIILDISNHYKETEHEQSSTILRNEELN